MIHQLVTCKCQWLLYFIHKSPPKTRQATCKPAYWERQTTYLLPPASAVEVIESVPSVCVCVCLSVCLSFSTLTTEPFDVSIMAKGLSGEGTLQHGSREVRQRSDVFIEMLLWEMEWTSHQFTVHENFLTPAYNNLLYILLTVLRRGVYMCMVLSCGTNTCTIQEKCL